LSHHKNFGNEKDYRKSVMTLCIQFHAVVGLFFYYKNFLAKGGKWMIALFFSVAIVSGHKLGILGDFSEHGKFEEFCATWGKIVTNKVVLVCHSNIGVKQLLTG